MTQIFGEFIEKHSTREKLTLEFLPDSISVEEFWRNNDLSANFIADFLTTFVTKNDQEETNLQRQTEIKSSMSYIANELLENSVKYCHQASQLPITIKLYIDRKKIRFFVTNSINKSSVASFVAFVEELMVSDANELYFSQLEKNAEDENSTASGLGLLSMINDYSAMLGWKFETIQEKPEIITVTTMVQLTI